MASINARKRAVAGFTWAVAACLALFATGAAAQDYKVNVNVNAAKTGTFMSPRAVGVQVSMGDNDLGDPKTTDLLRATGVTALRFPGRDADAYHWSTNTATAVGGKSAPYVAPASFARFVSMLDRTGAAGIVTVNYGSNLNGTGGGEPAEAAAWVAYANGDPNDQRTIGKDSTGQDWKTVGYWAALRSSAPLPVDDGLNALRLGHPRALRIRYWEVGNEVYANGYYSHAHKDGGTTADLHAPYGATPRESEKLRSKHAGLAPEAYAKNFVEFSKAMKAVDATIKIGVVLDTPPGDSTWGPEWNREVLKAAGPVADFAVLQWHPSPVLPPDWKAMDTAALLDAPQAELPKATNTLLELFRKYCGTNAAEIQVSIAGFAPASWPKLNDPSVTGLFAAEALSSFMEFGVVNANWSDLRNAFLTQGAEPAPGYFGLQMARILLNPNDTFVEAKSNAPTLSVHAAKRADGGLGIMLVNKDPKRAAVVKVNIAGAKFGVDGMRFDYGKSNPTVARTQVTGLGESFTVTVPAYTVTDLRVAKAQ